jgi:hypothetical protein
LKKESTKSSDELMNLTRRVATFLEEIGSYDICKSLYEEALRGDIQLFGDSHARVATDYLNLSSVCEKLAHYSDAARYADKSLKSVAFTLNLSDNMSG